MPDVCPAGSGGVLPVVRPREHDMIFSTADWPLPEPEQRPLHQALLAALGPLDGQRLLDVGCGVGLFLRAAEDRGALVAGTDTAVERLEIARWALPDADLRVMCPHDALPFDSGTFDVVVSRGGAVVTELARVARPGGLVAVGGWDRPSGRWAEESTGHPPRLAPPTCTDGGLDGVLRSAGLTVRGSGEVRCAAASSTVAAAWNAVLGREDGLPRTFRYTVATVAPITNRARSTTGQPAAHHPLTGEYAPDHGTTAG
jgi:SAM-dependent methyltransferase